MTHINSRPSPEIEDKAIRMIRDGVLAHIRVRGQNRWSVPSNTVDQSYDVERRKDNSLACTCMAGQRDNHCCHLTVVQMLAGWSANWPEQVRFQWEDRPPFEDEPAEQDDDLVEQQATATPEPKPRRTTRRTQPKPEKDPLEIPEGISGFKRTFLERVKSGGAVEIEGADYSMIGKSGAGFGNTLFTALERRTSTLEALAAVKAAIFAAVRADDGTCQLCHEELQPFAQRSCTCPKCTIVLPRCFLGLKAQLPAA